MKPDDRPKNSFMSVLPKPRDEEERLLDLLLDPLRAPESRRRPIAESIAQALDEPTERVVAVLKNQQIDHLWFEAAGGPSALPEPLSSMLALRRSKSEARHRAQEQAIECTIEILGGQGIPFVIFKGAQLRRMLYRDPVLRPSADVDLLVRREQRAAAIQALVREGFRAVFTASNVSHEVSLVREQANLDLHWDVLRPGRARTELASWIIEGRAVEAGRPHPSSAATVVLMLVHSAITEYVSRRMLPAVDLDRWLRTQPPLWDEVLRVIDAAGLNTAAWVTLRWVRRWLGSPVPDEILAAVAPGRLRQAYLERWLRTGPHSLHQPHPRFASVAFSLALQDRSGDVLRAALAMLGAHRGASEELRRLKAATV